MSMAGDVVEGADRRLHGTHAMTVAVMSNLIAERRHARKMPFIYWVDPLADCAPEQPLTGVVDGGIERWQP